MHVGMYLCAGVCAHGDEDGRCHPSGLLSTSSETGPFIGLELTIRQRQGFLASESHGSTCLSTMHGF